MRAPNPNLFLIRMPKQQQEQKKGYVGKIIIPGKVAYMEYNLQAGEIVAIGEWAHRYFPEAQVGQMLLVHHMVEMSGSDEARAEDRLIDEDENYRYYVVTCYDFNGKGNETYGVWDGEKIIPNKDYIFFEAQPEMEDMQGFENTQVIDKLTTTTKSGLIVFNQWKEDREAKVAKMSELKKQIESLSKSNPDKAHIKVGILQKEEELEKLSREINSQTYEPHTIAYFNNLLLEWFDGQIAIGDTIFALNIACNYIFNFNNQKYIVAKTSYLGFVYRPELEIAS